MKYPEHGDPDHCSLCCERAGLPVTKVEIEYEQPQVRAPGEPCLCKHCEALRAEAPKSVLDEMLEALEAKPDAVQDVEISQELVDALLADD